MNNKEYIDNIFSGNVKDETRLAHEQIVRTQKGEKQLIKTGFYYIDDFLPNGLNNKMVFGGSRPSMGKTFNCDQLIHNLTDININPDNIEILRFNWEMITESLLLRELKKVLNKPMKEIISKPYTEEEKPKVIETVKKLGNKKIKNISKIIEGEDLRYLLSKFCSYSKENYKIVLVDHLHILNSKDRIDSFLGICNELKLENPNLCFVCYFQLNRTLETLWRGSKDSRPNPKFFRPHPGHIYNTDSLQQYADVIFTMIIPQVANLEEYAAVNKKYYKHLQDHFEEDFTESDWVKLKARNRIYYEIIKVRLVEDFDDPKLFCELLDPSKEEKSKETKPLFQTPVFETEKPVPINFDMNLAFGEPDNNPLEEDDEVPF